MNIDFLVHESLEPTKIGTIATRELKLVERNSVPLIEYSGMQVFSWDKKSFRSTIVSTSNVIEVTYVFPTSELYLDNEFRLSTGAYDDTVQIDMSRYDWHFDTLTAAIVLNDISTEYVPCDHHRRTFLARVISSE